MIITLKKNTPQPEIDRLIQNFEKQGVQVNMISGANYNVFGLVGDTADAGRAAGLRANDLRLKDVTRDCRLHTNWPTGCSIRRTP